MPLPRKEIFIPLWSFGLTMVRIGIRRSELPPSLLRRNMAFYLERTKAENTVTLMTVWQWHGQSTDIAKWLGSNKTKQVKVSCHTCQCQNVNVSQSLSLSVLHAHSMCLHTHYWWGAEIQWNTTFSRVKKVMSGKSMTTNSKAKSLH